MRKSTISMAIFNSYVSHYQRVRMPATEKARGSSPRRIWWVAAGKNLEERRLCMEEVNLRFSPESVYDIQ